ncbi:hypothetical protein CF319_g9344 [Tilletia indica]|uniref:Uncharacterized protein n=1 Tax=Tilletia indica TaxID=43049 RepID=A0A8T8SAA7_9BASI|nr:hypothetical protein CF319_g9344 [Tilletia indica]KAE8235800.1 hypothetical protein A4X13_0g9373 [Tilletia indica]
MRTVHTAELVSICAVVWTIAIVLVLVLVAAASFLLSLVAELTNSALRSFTPNAFQRSSNLFYLAQDCANLGTMSVVKEQSCQLAAVNSAVQLPTVRVGVALLEGVGLSMATEQSILGTLSALPLLFPGFRAAPDLPSLLRFFFGRT